ncbi:MAG TPA: hypothetical protein VMF52_12560 [Steroidobacteraceae bacterium]|nr:hypothetical protein [Steroidobacteraceae bacterium]
MAAHSAERIEAIRRGLAYDPRVSKPATHIPRALQLLGRPELHARSLHVAAIHRELSKLAKRLQPGSDEHAAVRFVLSRSPMALRKWLVRHRETIAEPTNAKGAPNRERLS